MRSDILLLRSSRRLLTVLSILVEVRMGAVGALRPSGPPGLLDPWGSLGPMSLQASRANGNVIFFVRGTSGKEKGGGGGEQDGPERSPGVFACWHKRWSPARR